MTSESSSFSIQIELQKYLFLKIIVEKFKEYLKTVIIIVSIAIVLKSRLTKNELKDNSKSDVDKMDWHDWDLIDDDKLRASIGEHGVPTYLQSYPSSSKEINDTHGFNGYLSDKIALKRALMDLRPKEYVRLFKSCVLSNKILKIFSGALMKSTQ